MSENTQNESKSEIKSLKNIKSLEDLKEDFGKVELIRGETPPDIEEKCLQLCKDYLSGNWCQQTVDTIEVRRVSGGFINQLYYCGIKEPDVNEVTPQEVAIRLYGQNLFDPLENSRTRDAVIALTFSENKLGTKIYGLFEGGQIQKFYKHRQFLTEEQKIPAIRDSVFKTLAKIHCLEVPIKKNTKWLFNFINKCYQETFDKYPIEKEMDEYNCEALKKCDFKAELDLVINVGESARSPIIFTHNDFRSSNLMITEPNDELVVCDFDITGYSYRGYDFVSLSGEWGRSQFDMGTAKGIWFDEDEFKSLIEIYVEECVRIKGKSYSENPINSVEHILKEVKSFLLLSTLFHVLYLISNDETKDDFPFNRKICMEMADKRLETYYSVKEALKEQNFIK